VLLERGDVDRGRRFLREGVEVMRQIDPRGLLPWGFAWLARAAGYGGDAKEAASSVRAAEAAAPPGSWIHTAAIEMGRAWASAAEGAFSEARRSALIAAETSLEHGCLGEAFLDFHQLVRLGHPQAASTQLAKLTQKVDGDLVRACAVHAAALAASDAASLRDAAGRFEEAGALLVAAEALSEAGAAFRRDGRMSSARACIARARALLNCCGGARTPALRAIDGFDDLTAREREIATLAARGFPNKTIAARLVVSVRTVENALQRAYHKLGITSRTELAPLLGVEVRRPAEME
jgi:DNA-binding NarL/FixJ family response regulator